MSLTGLLILAQSSGDHTAEAPGSGVGIPLLVGTLLGIALLFALIFFVFHRGARRSKGGVEPERDDLRRGDPPLESVHRSQR